MRKTNPLVASDRNPELTGKHLRAENDDVAHSGLSLTDALQDAIESGSNEIHFEQDAQLCRIRKRINGQLDESRIESANLVTDLITEVETISNINVGSRNPVVASQGDLIIALEINDSHHDLECVYYPTTSGHNLSIRIAGTNQLPETLEQTSLDSSQISLLRDHFTKKSHGLTLICGPDTNMLQDLYYGLLGETNCVEDKIVSLEHHCARDIPRINQLSLSVLENAEKISQLATRYADKLFIDWQCAKNKTLIKNVLNNYQSATIFISAQNASIAISQLTDYALNERQLSTNLSTILHLDSIRTVCSHCANSHELSGADMQWLEGQAIGKKSNGAFVYAPGCDRCDYTGSQTSRPLMSLCRVDDTLRNAIETRNSSAVENVLQKQTGMNSIERQIAALVSTGKVSFTEYKAR